jgi:hypothetical protein
VIDDATSEPIANAVVWSGTPPSSDATNVLNRSQDPRPTGRSATSGADGSFSIEVPASGPGESSTLLARAAGHFVGFGLASEGTRIRLRSGTPIAGRVVSAADGSPIGGARVVQESPAGASTAPPGASLGPLFRDVATSGDDGSFELVVDPASVAKRAGSGASADLVTIAAHHAGFVPARSTDALSATSPRRLAMTPALALTIRVSTSDGRKPSGLVASWRIAGTRPSARVVPLAPGLFEAAVGPDELDEPTRAGDSAAREEIGPLKIPCDAPTVSLEIRAAGYVPHVAEEMPLPKEGGTKRLDVTLARDPQAAALHVDLRGPAGESIPFDERATVSVRRVDGGPLAPVEPLPDGGTLVLDGIAAGRYEVRVFRAGFGPATIEAAAEPGVATTARAVFDAERRITLRLSGVVGRRASVRVTAKGQPVFPTIASDPSGRASPARTPVSGVDSLVFLLGAEPLVLGGLGSGPHRVELVSPDLVGAPVDFEPSAASEPPDVTFAVSPR